MKPGLLKTLSLAVLTGMILISCGGGGGNNFVASNSGGIGGTGVVYGPITGFGSIFVNGYEIDIASAGITADGSDVTESALKMGMVVKVNGDFDANNLIGTATAVTYKDNLEGPITSIDIANNQLVVLGQTVIVSSATNFEDSVTFADPFGLADLAVGNVIEVSGLVDNTGAIVASHVEKKANTFSSGSTTIEVKGTIQNLNPLTGTFQINSLVIDYFFAGPTLPQGGLVNGQYVEVKGMSFNVSDELVATSIEIEDEGIGSEEDHDGDYVEIEGYISSITSANQFVLNGLAIEIISSTRYEGGSSGDVQEGARVEVEGTITNGVLVAQKIEFEGGGSSSDDDDG